MGKTFNKKLEEIKNRDIKIIQGTKFKDDFYWLIEQVEQLQKDVDFFKKKQKMNTQITQELASLNDSRVVEILTKARIF